MPQRRVSTQVLKQRGSFRVNPGRYKDRLAEPKPSGVLGGPPKHLTREQRKIWRELLEIIPTGVACRYDRAAVELLVALMEKLRARQASCTDLLRLESLLSRFGMTPSDRSRVRVTSTASSEGSDPLDEFVQ